MKMALQFHINVAAAEDAGLVLRVHRRDLDAGHLQRRAGLELDHAQEAELVGRAAAGRHDQGGRAVDALQRRAVQVIAVRVRQDDQRDALERARRQGGRARPPERIQRAREARVGQHPAVIAE